MTRLIISGTGAVHLQYQGGWWLISQTQVWYMGQRAAEPDTSDLRVMDDEWTCQHVRRMAAELIDKARGVIG